jgi:NADH-quinone oxidoreductase subunit L
MYLPLVVLSFFAIGVAWPFLHLGDLLETARPAGTLVTATGAMYNVVIPDEHLSHDLAIKVPATWMAFFTGVVGVGLAYLIYGMQKLNPAEIARATGPVFGLLKNKWYFDEIYEFIFIKPVHFIARRASDFDKQIIDRIIHTAAASAKFIAKGDDMLDRFGVDGLVNGFAKFTRNVGYSFKGFQTGRLRQYIMFIAIGTIVLFLIVVIMASGSLSFTGR